MFRFATEVAAECTTEVVVDIEAGIAVVIEVAIAAGIAAVIEVAIAADTDGPMFMDPVASTAADTVVGDTQRADITAGTMARVTDTVAPAIAITMAATGMDGRGGRERSLTPIMTTIITMIITMHRQQVAVARQSIAPA